MARGYEAEARVVRAVLAGFARELTPATVNVPETWPCPCPRAPGFPSLEDAEFLLDEDAGMAVHEAGHASVALALGLTLHGVGSSPTKSLGEGTASGYHCEISGPAGLARSADLCAAGLVSEILVWGPGTYWARSLNDLVALARQGQVERMGAIRHAAARGWRAARLPTPAALDLSLSAADLFAARDGIPDSAIAAAAAAFPATLRIAEILHGRWAAGETYVTGEDIARAAEGERPAPAP